CTRVGWWTGSGAVTTSRASLTFALQWTGGHGGGLEYGGGVATQADGAQGGQQQHPDDESDRDRGAADCRRGRGAVEAGGRWGRRRQGAARRRQRRPATGVD